MKQSRNDRIRCGGSGISDPRVLERSSRSIANLVPPWNAPSVRRPLWSLTHGQTFRSRTSWAMPGAAPDRDDTVLEIGTGSGFHDRHLHAGAGSLYRRTVDFSPPPEDRVRHGLQNYPFHAYGRGLAGWPHRLPYDRHLVTCRQSADSIALTDSGEGEFSSLQSVPRPPAAHASGPRPKSVNVRQGDECIFVKLSAARATRLKSSTGERGPFRFGTHAPVATAIPAPRRSVGVGFGPVLI